MINVLFVLRSLLRGCYGDVTREGAINLGNFCKRHFDCLQYLLWRFDTKCSMAICIRELTPVMMQLHRGKIW